MIYLKGIFHMLFFAVLTGFQIWWKGVYILLTYLF